MMTTALLPPSAPGGLPLLGHLPALARDPLGFFLGLRAHGPVVRIGLGTRVAYVLTTSELVRRVYVSEQHRFDKGGALIEKVRDYAGNGLATCPAAEHAVQRPLMQPAFQRDRLVGYGSVVRDAIEEVTGEWTPGRVVDLTVEMHRLTTLVTSRTLVTADRGVPAAGRIAEGLPDITRGMYWRMLVPGKVFPRIPLQVNRRFDEQTARTRAAVDAVVEQYRADPTDRGDLLSAVLAACEEDPDPRQAVYDQVITLLTAGVETAASAMTWTLRALDSAPEVRDRVVAEAVGVLGGRVPAHADLAALGHAQRAVTEALRLWPPVWLVSRCATEDVDWAEGRVPAGADVFFSPYALHRDAAVFPEPEVFDPGRWAGERVTAAQRGGFFGFGAGRRKCIGDALAVNEVTAVVAAVLSRFRLVHLEPGVTSTTARMLLMPPATWVRVERQ
ncbi:pentalenene oxygenase [Actinosynnema pretiosum]|nr:pentalenene oxygenase [Actinosynnema pretiosum]